MAFFSHIGRPAISLAQTDGQAVQERAKRNLQRTRSLPVAGEPGSAIKRAKPPPPPKSSVPQYDRAAAKEGQVLKLKPQGYSRIFGLTGSVLYAAAALL